MFNLLLELITPLIIFSFEGNFWQFVWTAGATISSANAVIVRFKCKQHPSV